MIKIAIDVIRAELLAIAKPMLGLKIDKVGDIIFDDDPIKFSEIIKSIFLLKLFLFFLSKPKSVVSDFKLFFFKLFRSII